MKQTDLIFGTAGTVGTLTLSQVNQTLALISGVLTTALMIARVVDHWHKRKARRKKSP